MKNSSVKRPNKHFSGADESNFYDTFFQNFWLLRNPEECGSWTRSQSSWRIEIWRV